MATVIEGVTGAEVWEKGVKFLLKNGNYVPSVRGPVLELPNTSLVVKDPWQEPRISKQSPMFREAEDFSSSLRAHPRIVNWNGLDQTEQIVKIIRDDPLTRRAVISVWNPEHDLFVENAQGVVSFVFSIREDALHLTSFFRTTDAWMCNWTLAGVPELQQTVHNELQNYPRFERLAFGTYTQIHVSFHIYLDEVPNAEFKLLRRQQEGA